MQTQLPQIYYIIFTAVTALGVLLQALVLLGMYFAIRQSTKKLHEATEEFKAHVIPAISSARRLIDDVSPKLKIASSNLVDASHTLRHQANHVNTTVEDLLNKTSVQASRVNEMVGGVLDSVDRATGTVQHALAVPYRQLSGILTGFKVGLDVLLKKEKAPAEQVDPVVVRIVEEEEVVGQPKGF